MKIIFEKGDNESNYANYMQSFFRGQVDGLDIRIIPTKVTIKKNEIEMTGIPECVNLSERYNPYECFYFRGESLNRPPKKKYDIEIKMPTKKDELE